MTEHVVMPKMHFSKRVRQQYNCIHFALAREAVQNASDAGASEVVFKVWDHEFRASDDGCGMTLDETRENYLTLGASGKDDNEKSVGTFGAAKELLSFAWETWYLEGQGFKITGSGTEFEAECHGDTGRDEGFMVGAKDDEFQGWELEYELQGFARLSNIDMDITLEHHEEGEVWTETLPQGRTLRRNQVVRSYEFGDLYVHKSEPGPGETPGYLYVRTRGLFTCKEYVGGDKVWYLLLDEASDEVLTENRDSLKWKVRNQVKEEVRALIDSGASDKRSSSELVVHGMEPGQCHRDTDEAFSGERGTYHASAINSNLWRKPWCVATESGSVRVKTSSGNPRPSFTKALEILDKATKLICSVTGLAEPIVGLYFNDDEDINGIHATVAGRHVIAISPDLLHDDSAFGVVDLVIHELAHYSQGSHNQSYECARRRIARDAGKVMTSIIDSVKREQCKPRQNGRYWEAE